jgi:dTDP-3-amino-3,4,6-trideoxy-alpha-D-glucopyranose N,N-dimethyltransferase
VADDAYINPDAYDAIYTAMKDYEAEATMAMALVGQWGHSPQNTASLLDVACGTGLHLQYWAGKLASVEGIDLDENQLAGARKRLPDVPLHQGDMRALKTVIDRQFDVVTCLFSAIGHMRTTVQLRRAIKSMAGCLKPGGVLILEPWLTPANWNPQHGVSAHVGEGPGVTVARVTRSTKVGRLIKLEMHYTLGYADRIEHHSEHHELTLFTFGEYQEAFRRAELATHFYPTGISNNERGTFIGVKSN